MSRALLILMVAGVALLGYSGAELVALSTHFQPNVAESGAAAPASLPWLHVEHTPGQVAYIADPSGRRVILRGVVSGALVDYWSGTDRTRLAPPPFYPLEPAAYAGSCPRNSAEITQPPLCQEDLVQMRALGFNVLRLALSWSLLEAEPGRYDRVYIERIAQVVRWAREQGIYVILDMHENGYSRYFQRPVPAPWPGGEPPGLNLLSGAPPWAVIADSLPSETYIGQREINPAIDAAFTNFWINRGVNAAAGEAPGTGLQDHYIGAIAALARRFRDESTVVGLGPFNEPWPGFISPPWFEDLYLVPFYRRVVDAITGSGGGLPCPASTPALALCGYPDLGVRDRRHLFFLEPDHLREQIDFATHLPVAVSAYGNLVYSIHVYTHSFTIDALLGQSPQRATYPPGGFDQTYASAEKEARALGAALFVSEFGNSPDRDGTLLVKELAEQDQHRLGSTFWAWKENCGGSAPWGVFDGVYLRAHETRCAFERTGTEVDTAPKPSSGCLRQGRERLLARVWPRASAASDLAFHYEPGSGAFGLSAVGRRGEAPTVLYVPPQVTGDAAVGGAAELAGIEVGGDGSRLVTVRPHGGAFTITVAPAPAHLSGCSP